QAATCICTGAGGAVGASARGVGEAIDLRGGVGGAEAVVDIDDGDAAAAGGEHAEQGGEAAEAGAVADAGGDGDDGPGDEAGAGEVRQRFQLDGDAAGGLVPAGLGPDFGDGGGVGGGGAGDEEGAAVLEQGAGDGADLVGGFALAKDDFGEAAPTLAVGIDAG